MAQDALTLEIVLQSEQAQRALETFRQGLERTGATAEEKAKALNKFEAELVRTHATAQKSPGVFGAVTAKLDDMIASAAALGTGGLIAAVGGAMFAATKFASDYAAGIDKASKAARVHTDTMQELDFLAKKNGTSFSALARAMHDLDARLVTGSKTTSAAVASIGLEVDDLLGLSRDDRFRAIATAIAGMQDPAQQAQIAVALLGGSAADLLPVLDDMAAGAGKAAHIIDADLVAAGARASATLDSLTENAMSWAATGGLAILQWTYEAIDGWTQLAQAIGLVGIKMEQVKTPAGPGKFWFDNASTSNTFDPLQGNSMEFWERRLTQDAQTQIRQREAAARASASGIVTPYSPLEWRSRYTNPQAILAAQGGMLMPNFAFPGWAPSALPNSMNLGFGGAAANGSGAWMLRPTVGMNAPGGGGGGFFGNILGGVTGGFKDMWKGMTGGKGLSGLLGNLGSGLVTGGINSLLGAGIGLVGKGISKLFGGEGKETNRTRDAAIEANFGSVDNLREAAEKAGFSVDKLLSTKKIKDFNAEFDKLQQAIRESEADAARVEDAMERWGLTVEDMGPKFQQTKINNVFKEAMEDIRVLTNAGADFNTIAEKMAPQLGAMVHEAIEMGGTVPREMEPILKKMIELGLLTDKNGEKFTDLSQIPFAADLNKDFTTLIGKMDALIAKLAGLPGLFGDATAAANDFANAAPDGSGVPGGGAAPGFDAGGVVGRHWRRPSSRDTIWARLRPGELVLTPEQQRAGGARGSGMAVGVTINVAGYLDSPSARANLAGVVKDEISRELRQLRVAS